MSSTITNYSQNIDINFPIAGQDNDTQGFRDNYNFIQSALGTAATEITNIQTVQETLSTVVAGNIQTSSPSIQITNNTINVNNTNTLYVVYSVNPTDTISTVTGGISGQLIYLRAQSANEKFSITTSGNIASTGTIVSTKYSPFIYDTSVWYPVGNI